MIKNVKTSLKVVLGIALIVAGLNHFRSADFYLRMMPPYLPWHLELVYISGIAEILLGILLLVRRTSAIAAWGIIALLIAVFPANLQMALEPDQFPNIPEMALWLRLPLQAVLIAWAYWYTRSPSRRNIHHP